MRTFIALLFTLALGTQAFAQIAPGLKLYRVVYVKLNSEPDTAFKVFREFKQIIHPSTYAIDTFYYHEFGPRMETVFLSSIKYDGKTLKAKVKYESNDFPMDAYWDVHWSKDVTFIPNIPLSHRVRILDRTYFVQITHLP